ncbi:MAG: zinc ribbon domain-containing protein [Treponema sp.]
MVMTEIFNKLKSLQVILGRKYELENKINEAPKQLDSQGVLLDRMRKEFIEKNHVYESVKEKVLQLKKELDEAVSARESGEKNMDVITTHREYEALEKQISEASAKEAEVRKALQKEEKSLAELNDAIKTMEEMIKAQENDIAESRRTLDGQLDNLKAELAELNNRENEIIPGLDQEVLFKFQRIIQRNSEGIVAVKNGVCTGCNMILPAQFANEVHEGDSILFCPYCSRILFYEESEENTQETYFDDAGSLADIEDDFVDEEEIDEDAEDELFDDREKELSDDEDDIDDEDSDDDDAEEEDPEEDSEN